MSIKGKKVTVVGLARSGVAAANFLASAGAKVFATDSKGPDALAGSIGRLDKSIELSLGGHPDRIFLEPDFIIVSPGVPMDIRPLRIARERGIPVISELELAYLLTELPFITITGTNGKSTTTTLTDLMLRKSGIRTILGGNIGKALTEEIYRSRFTSHDSRSTVDRIVAEVSSFQLEGIDTFRPAVAVILNITPDHLDRYKDMKEYVNAKARIFENQGKSDFLILNGDDSLIAEIENEYLKEKNEKPRVFYFSRRREVEGIYLKDGMIYCNIPDSPLATCPMPLIGLWEIKIKGVHNIENAMAAAAASLLSGGGPESIREALMEFEGLEHRLEFVDEIKGVRFINDSKGTNIGAVLKSLEGFESPVILIAGGLDKASDFKTLRDPVKEKVRYVILIGEAKDKIAKALDGLTDISYAATMEEAVGMAAAKGIPGDTVLLSPACASFDMFKDFEDRGRKFKESVRRLRHA